MRLSALIFKFVEGYNIDSCLVWDYFTNWEKIYFNLLKDNIDSCPVWDYFTNWEKIYFILLKDNIDSCPVWDYFTNWEKIYAYHDIKWFKHYRVYH